ncbi:MAG: hypothetical protein JRI23_06550 [Deltaproteobacteria bacterium]|nr:hypothetical protein [Deltaproteobacteria bacterium]MBW2531248.1 hypothetical protein [Deltaproteobacteria bacterium]
MPPTIDLDRRRISLTVAELVRVAHARAVAPTLRGKDRAELGRWAHRRYREWRGAACPGFRSEVPVELLREVDGFDVRVGGRVDGWYREGSSLVVEEAKSVVWSMAELDRVSTAELEDYAAQVQLYALAAQGRHPRTPLVARLALLSLIDDGWRVLPVPFAKRDVEQMVAELVRRAIRWERRAAERRARLATVAARLRFPYATLRPGQAELMERIRSGLDRSRPLLLQAATGSGKTVCALLPALRHGLAQDAAVWFVTAKTTQQPLVARTFLDLCAASDVGPGELYAITLRAKERMCPTGDLQCHEQLCPFLRDFEARLDASGLSSRLTSARLHLAPDGIYGEATRAGLCPFRASLALTADAGLIIADYNYVYDSAPSTAAREGGPGNRPQLVIVDEAHNLAERVREARSPFVSLAAVRGLLRRGRRRHRSGHAASPAQLELLDDPIHRETRDLRADLHRIAAELEAEIASHLVAAGRARDRWVHGCATVELEPRRWQQRRAAISRWLLRYGVHCRARGIVRPRDPVVDLLRRIGAVSAAVQEPCAQIVPYVAGEETERGAGVGAVCLDPAHWLERHHRAAAGTVMMSATLQPAAYYAAVLGLAPLSPLVSSVPSPFPPEHRCVRIAPSVSTSYLRRRYTARAVARIIGQVVQAKPGRYAAYFPSFSYLEAVERHLALPGVARFVQVPFMEAEERRGVLRALRTCSGPALLLAVAGGVFAEGIDLPGDALIGAIIVGPALPRLSFERAMMRRHFHVRHGRGFAYAMLVPGMQKVVQAAGRVIRAPEDRGVIVLVGRRFVERDYAACLPSEWYHVDPRELCTDDVSAALRTFWERAMGGPERSAP